MGKMSLASPHNHVRAPSSSTAASPLHVHGEICLSRSYSPMVLVLLCRRPWPKRALRAVPRYWYRPRATTRTTERCRLPKQLAKEALPRGRCY